MSGVSPESSLVSTSEQPTLTIHLPQWAINSLTFALSTWIVFSLLMAGINRLEGDRATRWQRPLTHSNPQAND